MNETQRRPWWRLHLISCVLVALLASALLYLNVFRRQTETEYAVVCIRGWPTPMFEEGTPRRRIVFITNSNLEKPEPTYPSWRPLFVASNVAASLSIVGAATYGVERFLRRSRHRPQFGLRFVLVVTSCIATFVAIERAWDHTFLAALADASLGLAVIGVVLAWFGFFEILHDFWNALGSRYGAMIVNESTGEG